MAIPEYIYAYGIVHQRLRGMGCVRLVHNLVCVCACVCAVEIQKKTDLGLCFIVMRCIYKASGM